MTLETKRNGNCLCGAVTITIDFAKNDVGACHCIKCRKWAGGPLFEVECGTDVSFDGEENIQSYASSEWGERGFCKICGSHLFFKDKTSGEYGIPPGLFEQDEGFRFNRQVFFDHKPEYYSFSNKTRNITSDYIYKHFPQTREDT